MGKPKHPKRKHVMTFVVAKGQPLIRVPMRYRDSTVDVDLTVNEIDTINGVPGHAAECAGSQCALRLRDLFPHPVFFAEFTDTRAYIVDKMKDGLPVSCVRYPLANDVATRNLTKCFDRAGGKTAVLSMVALAKKMGLSGHPIRLLATPKYIAQKKQSGRVGVDHNQAADTPRSPLKATPLPKGSYARAVRTGQLQLG